MSSSSQNNWQNGARGQQEDPAHPWETGAPGKWGMQFAISTGLPASGALRLALALGWLFVSPWGRALEAGTDPRHALGTWELEAAPRQPCVPFFSLPSFSGLK